MLAALTKGLPEGGRTTPLDGLLVAGIAFFTVSGVGKRPKLRMAAFVVVGSAMLFGFLSGEVTALALLVTALFGWTVGLVTLFAIGAASTRPPGTAVAAALIGCGLDITRLELVESTGVRGRQYAGSGPVGSLDVRVLERDTFGTEAGRRVLRRVRLRGPSARGPSLTIRDAVEHHALMALAVAKAGVRAPELLATAEVGPYAAVLAYRRRQQRVRPGVDAHLVQEVLDRHTAPYGIADEVAAHLVGDATNRDPGFTQAAVEQVLIGQRQFFPHQAVDAQPPFGGIDERHGQRGVNAVEIIGRSAPWLRPGDAKVCARWSRHLPRREFEFGPCLLDDGSRMADPAAEYHRNDRSCGDEPRVAQERTPRLVGRPVGSSAIQPIEHSHSDDAARYAQQGRHRAGVRPRQHRGHTQGNECHDGGNSENAL